MSIRVDPLTGERTIVASDPGAWLTAGAAVPPAEARPELFTALAAEGAVAQVALAAPLAQIAPEQLAGDLERCREAMRGHASASYVHLDAAGAHARLVALPFVPSAVARERERFGAYATRTLGGNLLGDLVQEEVRRRERLVAYDAEAVLLSGFAAAEPYALTLVPRRVVARFEDDTAGAALLARVLAALAGESPLGPSFWVRTAPAGADSFCWRVEVRPGPRVADALEAATGLRVASLAPEDAAARVRERLK